jgi:carbon storage regulator
MLIVRRRAGEAIVVAGDVEIEVIEITRTRVKLGVRAPREVSVTRREAQTVASENRNAAGLLAACAVDADILGFFGKISGKGAKTAEGTADM